MFTEFSLQALVDISKSRMSSRLGHVIIGLERPSMNQYGASPAPNQQPDIYVKSNRFRQEYIDHMALLATNQDIEMLAEAFSKLPNLEIVGIRDFYSRSRNRDFPNNQWKSMSISFSGRAPNWKREGSFEDIADVNACQVTEFQHLSGRPVASLIIHIETSTLASDCSTMLSISAEYFLAFFVP
jgi:hypothetical protein